MPLSKILGRMYLLHLWVTEEQEEAIHLLFITNDWSFRKSECFESVNTSASPSSSSTVNTSSILHEPLEGHATSLVVNSHQAGIVTNTSHTCPTGTSDYFPDNNLNPTYEENNVKDSFMFIRDILKQGNYNHLELTMKNISKADCSLSLGDKSNENDNQVRCKVFDGLHSGRLQEKDSTINITPSDTNKNTARFFVLENGEVIQKNFKNGETKSNLSNENVQVKNFTSGRQDNIDGNIMIEQHKANEIDNFNINDLDIPGNTLDNFDGNSTEIRLEINKHSLYRETEKKTDGSKLANELKNDKCHNESTYSKEDSFYCKLCKHSFKYKKSYDKHVAKGKCKQVCHICGKVFLYGTTSNYKVHLQYHMKLRGHVCNICGDSFIEKGKLREHIRKHKGTTHYICDVCGMTFTGYANLYSHNKVHHTKSKDLLQCEKCPKRFKYMNGLKYHLKYYHEKDGKGMDPTYSCTICEKVLKTPELLKRHETVHKDTRDFVCNVCGAAFVRIQGLSEHMKRHRKEYTCFCSVCGKGFYTRTTLKQHMLVHTGEKPFKCQHCDFKCALKGNLTKHMKIHKDMK